MTQPTAVILGVGDGLGAALARRFAKGGFAIAVAARRLDRVEPIAAALRADGHTALAIATDAGDEAQVDALCADAEDALGPLTVAIHNASTYVRARPADLGVADFERVWRVTTLGGFLLGRAAVRCMQRHGRGSLLFSGATASLRGSAEFGAFAAAKGGLRLLAQSFARAYGPEGIHVAHVVIDGVIGARGTSTPDRLDPDDIAAAYWALHVQPRSAWTHEIDLRPAAERF